MVRLLLLGKSRDLRRERQAFGMLTGRGTITTKLKAYTVSTRLRTHRGLMNEGVAFDLLRHQRWYKRTVSRCASSTHLHSSILTFIPLHIVTIHFPHDITMLLSMKKSFLMLLLVPAGLATPVSGTEMITTHSRKRRYHLVLENLEMRAELVDYRHDIVTVLGMHTQCDSKPKSPDQNVHPQ